MANSADPDQLQKPTIWIFTICKGRVYPGSAGQELTKKEEEERVIAVIAIVFPHSSLQF